MKFLFRSFITAVLEAINELILNLHDKVNTSEKEAE